MRYESTHIPGVHRFLSDTAGPSVVIVGGIHGDEPCGVLALERLTNELYSGERVLKRGSLTLIHGNLEAQRSNKRFERYNLNRLFKVNSTEEGCYELDRAEELKPLFMNVDYVLDLHSTSKPAPPFIVCEEAERTVACSLDIDWIVMGWTSLDPLLEGDTCTWASRHGAQAMTLECGQHLDSRAREVAFRAATRLLDNLGMIAPETQGTTSRVPRIIHLYHAEILRERGFKYSRNYCGFDAVAAGECIGQDSHGVRLAVRSSRMIFPANPETTALGTELYMLGYEE